MTQHFHVWVFAQEKKKKIVLKKKKGLARNILKSLIHHHLKLKTAQMSVSRKTDFKIMT